MPPAMAMTSVIAMVERNRPFRLDRAHAQTAAIVELSRVAIGRAMVVTRSRLLVLSPLPLLDRRLDLRRSTRPHGLPHTGQPEGSQEIKSSVARSGQPGSTPPDSRP